MTRIAVDCEFNSFGGQLISMALVTEHGDEWYMQLELPDNLGPMGGRTRRPCPLW
jgi:hypothetical protein